MSSRISPASLDLNEGLQRLGYDCFRPGQQQAIEILLETGRMLLVAPTGGGKSLAYQLPGALLPGITLVISPLVALMHDQVESLLARGIPATYLAATQGAEAVRARMGEIGRGEYKLVYVAPERLAYPGFRALLARLPISLVAVDEAHCISEWGHDFRPEYLQIGELLRELSCQRVMACTATATPVVRDEILAKLGMPADTPQIVRGFARPNLALRAVELQRGKDRPRHVDAMLAEALGAPGDDRGTAIVYAPTRRASQEEASRLAGRAWRVAAYHAGLDGRHREDIQRAFREGELEVIVATNAFGMGIDRSDVRAVIHLAPPGSIEAYYQEVGRAGRDGHAAFGMMLVASTDMPMRRRLLERDIDGRAPDPAVIEHKWGMFLELMRWAEGGSCRHDAILRYFGDEAETLAGCGRCDVCQTLADDREAQDHEQVALIVRKALSGVARVHGRFGLQAAAQLLCGEADPRLQRAELDQTRTFGVMRGEPLQWVQRLLRRCVSAGWVEFAGERPVVFLTPSGRDVMMGKREPRLLLPQHDSIGTPRTASAGSRTAPRRADPRAEDQPLEGEAVSVFAALRRYRMERARADNVPPYVIASDRTLRDIATLRPRTPDELSLAHGIGPAKVARYGDDLLSVVANAASEAC